MQTVETAYDNYEFYTANQALVAFATIDLSAFYLDIAKDRLYISAAAEARRRSCQTVLYHTLMQMTKMMAPIVPHMAEDVWLNLPFPRATDSVFESGWVKASDRFPAHEQALWGQLRALRDDVNKCIEAGRQAKEFGSSAEAGVFIHSSNPELTAALQRLKGDAAFLAQAQATNGIDDLRFVLMTSQVDLCASSEEVLGKCKYTIAGQNGLTIGVSKASGKKCDRCWYYSDNVGHDHDHNDICLRCAAVVKAEGYTFEDSAAAAV